MAYPSQQFNFSGLANAIPEIMQGYQLGAMPKQMRQQDEEGKLRKAILESQAKYAPQMAEMNFQSASLQNRLANQSAQQQMAKTRAVMQALGINDDSSSQQQPPPPQSMQQQPVTYNEMGGAQQPMGQPAQSPFQSGFQPNNQSQQKPPMQPMQGMQQQNSMIPQQQSQQPQSIQQKADVLWQTRPELRGELEKMGFKGKQQFFPNSESGTLASVTTLPSGTVDVQSQPFGLPPQERTLQSELAKGKAKEYMANVDAYNTSSTMLNSLNDFDKEVIQNPRLSGVIGGKGAKSLATYFAGSPEDQALLGRIESEQAQQWVNSIQSMKGMGALSDAEGNKLLQMIPNTKDTPAMFKSKFENLKNKAEQMVKKHYSTAKSLEEGKSPLQASKSIGDMVKLKNSKTGQYSYFTREEAKAMGVPGL